MDEKCSYSSEETSRTNKIRKLGINNLIFKIQQTTSRKLECYIQIKIQRIMKIEQRK